MDSHFRGNDKFWYALLVQAHYYFKNLSSQASQESVSLFDSSTINLIPGLFVT